MVAVQPDGGTIPTKRWHLTPIQRWFLDEGFPYPEQMAFRLIVTTSRPIKESALIAAAESLMARHTVLRSVLERDDIHWGLAPVTGRDVVCGGIAIDDISGSGVQEAAHQMASGINCFSGPMWLMRLVHTPNGSHILIVIHQLITDGVSLPLFLRELDAVLTGRPTTVDRFWPYAKWSEALVELVPSAQKLSAFWERQVAGMHSQPQDCVKLRNETHAYALSSAGYSAVWNTAKRRRVRPQGTLLAAISLAFKRAEIRTTPAWTIVGSGRAAPILDARIAGSQGWFQTRYPLVIPVHEPCNISLVADAMRSVRCGGHSFGALRYYANRPQLIGYSGATFDWIDPVRTSSLASLHELREVEVVPAWRKFERPIRHRIYVSVHADAQEVRITADAPIDLLSDDQWILVRSGIEQILKQAQ